MGGNPQSENRRSLDLWAMKNVSFRPGPVGPGSKLIEADRQMDDILRILRGRV